MIGALLGLALAGSATSGEMTVGWRIDGDRVLVELEAPTTGWMAVGFNGVEDLAGSRLAMVAVVDGKAAAEEHVARPPAHTRVAELEVLRSEQRDGWTRVALAVPLKSEREGALELASDQRVWLTVAWSHSPDLQHHSASRTASWQTL